MVKLANEKCKANNTEGKDRYKIQGQNITIIQDETEKVVRRSSTSIQEHHHTIVEQNQPRST